MRRVVVDTNILVSGTIVTHGFSAKIVDAVLDNRVLLVTSEYLLSEYSMVMQRPHIARKYRRLGERLDDILAFSGIRIISPRQFAEEELA